jgi:hypothetical protein
MSLVNKYTPDFLLVIGMGLIVGGVALMHVPAALITAGVLMICFAWLVERERGTHAAAE